MTGKCTRLTKAGKPCKHSAVEWAETITDLADPQSCRTHLTRAEFRLWLVSEAGRARAGEERAIKDAPACWSWPVTSQDQDRAAAAPSGPPYAAMSLLEDWQAGRCALCGHTPAKLMLDHDHTTGYARGLLCQSCNTQEGHSSRALMERYRFRPPTVILGLSIYHSDPDSAAALLGPNAAEALQRHQDQRDPARRR